MHIFCASSGFKVFNIYRFLDEIQWQMDVVDVLCFYAKRGCFLIANQKMFYVCAFLSLTILTLINER